MNWAIIEQVIVMALLTGCGFFCRKIKMLDDDSTKKLTGIVINFVIPMVIIVSYQKPFDPGMLNGLLTSFLLAAVSYAVSFVIIPLIVRSKREDIRAAERFSCIYSNCAFMGIPLIQGVYGTNGVFFLTAYVTMFNILAWTHGFMMMKGGKFSFKSLGKALLTPGIIATVVGIILFLCSIPLPSPILSAAKHLANLNTPLAMLIAGSTIATVRITDALKKPKLYYICFVKLILLPAILMAICLIFSFDAIISGVNILACACPTAALGTMLALKFDRNSGYCSEIFAATTILSMVTLPLILMVYTSLAGGTAIA